MKSRVHTYGLFQDWFSGKYHLPYIPRDAASGLNGKKVPPSFGILCVYIFTCLINYKRGWTESPVYSQEAAARFKVQPMAALRQRELFLNRIFSFCDSLQLLKYFKFEHFPLSSGFPNEIFLPLPVYGFLLMDWSLGVEYFCLCII